MPATDKYAISWEDAHGNAIESVRFGPQVSTFIEALFATPGCRLLGVEIIDRGTK